MRKIRLSDGTVYEVTRCGADETSLMFVVSNVPNLMDVCLKVAYPENTNEIEHWFEGTEADHIWYNGYTQLTSISNIGNGIQVTLSHPY